MEKAEGKAPLVTGGWTVEDPELGKLMNLKLISQVLESHLKF